MNNNLETPSITDPLTIEEEKKLEQTLLEAVLGFDGGEGWVNIDDPDWVWNTEAIDDPFAVITSKGIVQAMKAKLDDTLWEEEELEQEEVPEERQLPLYKGWSENYRRRSY